ncbi:MAG: glycosyltransferase family 2 protein [Paludibacter sp.]
MVESISIITINMNNEHGLKKTLESIDNQTYKNIELIIIDGNSTDNSLNVITSFNSLISKAVVEKDQGLYDAMNKGIDCATSDFAMFLNSGDVFSKTDSLEILTSKIEDKNKLYFGRAKNVYNNSTIYYLPSFKISESNYKVWLQSISPNHQAILFPKSFYKTNYYNLKYKIAADIDFKLRALNQLDAVFVDTLVIDFELGGISTVPRSLKLINQINKEGFDILKNNHRSVNFISTLKIIGNQYFKFLMFKFFGEKRYFNLIRKMLN